MLRLFRHHIAFSTVLLAVIETGLLFGLLAGVMYWSGLGAGLRAGPDAGFGAAATDPYLYLIAPISLAGFLIFAALGLYNRDIYLDLKVVALRAGLAIAPIVVVSGSLVALYADAARIDHRAAYLGGSAALLAAVGLVLAMRLGAHNLAGLHGFRRRVLVVGTGELAAKIHSLAGGRRQIEIVGYLPVAGEPTAALFDPEVQARQGAGALPAQFAATDLTRPGGLNELVAAHRIDEILVASREQRGLPVMALLDCKLDGLKVTNFLSFWEREAHQIALDELQPSWLIYSDGFKLDPLRQAVKRGFDITASLALLLVTLPVTLPAAAAVRLDSRGPILYRQDRVGAGGRTFQILKFRSMRTDAESDGVPRWAAVDDDRVTRVGQFLRRTRIDEIPQVINVLTGDMSFVGPRPERPYFVAELQAKLPYYGHRHRVKPGITGWAQINYPYGASAADTRQKLAYDLYYIKNGGLFLDLVTLVQTVRVVLWPDGVR